MADITVDNLIIIPGYGGFIDFPNGYTEHFGVAVLTRGVPYPVTFAKPMDGSGFPGVWLSVNGSAEPTLYWSNVSELGFQIDVGGVGGPVSVYWKAFDMALQF